MSQPIKITVVKKKYYVKLLNLDELINYAKVKFKDKNWSEEKILDWSTQQFNSSTENPLAGLNNNLVHSVYPNDKIELTVDEIANKINDYAFRQMQWGLAKVIYYEENCKFEDLYAMRELVTLDMIKSKIIETIPDKPKTFPLFNNETAFKAYTHLSPKILEIKWDGIEYSYRMQNVGHVYDFIPESKLSKL